MSDRHRYQPARVAVPIGHDLQALCVCCRYTNQSVSRDGLWAKCKRCDQDCTNVGCRDLMPGPRGIYGRLIRYFPSRLFR
jgi:hypothetical protein